MKQVLALLAIVGLLAIAGAAFAQDPSATCNCALVIQSYCTVSISSAVPLPGNGAVQTVTQSGGPAPYTFSFNDSASANFPCIISIAQTGAPADSSPVLTDTLDGTYTDLPTTNGTATLKGTTTWADAPNTYSIAVTLTLSPH